MPARKREGERNWRFKQQSKEKTSRRKTKWDIIRAIEQQQIKEVARSTSATRSRCTIALPRVIASASRFARATLFVVTATCRETFTVRKISFGVGVERTSPCTPQDRAHRGRASGRCAPRQAVLPAQEGGQGCQDRKRHSKSLPNWCFGRGPLGPPFLFHFPCAAAFYACISTAFAVGFACEMLRRMEKESSPRNEGNEWLKRLQKYERY